MAREPILGVLVTSCRERKKVRAYFQDASVREGEQIFILIFLTAGRAQVKFAGSEFKLGKGEAVILKPGDRYRLHPCGKTPLSLFMLHFSPVGTSGIFRSIPDMGLSVHSRVADCRRSLRLFAALSGLFLHRHRRIKPDPAQEASILALRILRLLESKSEVPSIKGPDDRSAEVRIWEVLKHIGEHYKDSPTIPELAEKAVLSPTYFKRVFRRITGFSPHRYILERKIEKAKDFLLVHGESLSTTAIELGFHDYPHFYRVFQNIAGLTPRQFLDESAKKESAARSSR